MTYWKESTDFGIYSVLQTQVHPRLSFTQRPQLLQDPGGNRYLRSEWIVQELAGQPSLL